MKKNYEEYEFNKKEDLNILYLLSEHGHFPSRSVYSVGALCLPLHPCSGNFSLFQNLHQCIEKT